MARKRYKLRKKVRMHPVTERLLVAGLLLGCVAAVFFTTFVVLKNVGKSSLKKHATEIGNQELTVQLSDEITNSDEPLELEEGQILVEGEVWEYNDDILTFLCMGVV